MFFTSHPIFKFVKKVPPITFSTRKFRPTFRIGTHTCYLLGRTFSCKRVIKVDGMASNTCIAIQAQLKSYWLTLETIVTLTILITKCASKGTPTTLHCPPIRPENCDPTQDRVPDIRFTCPSTCWYDAQKKKHTEKRKKRERKSVRHNIAHLLGCVPWDQVSSHECIITL